MTADSRDDQDVITLNMWQLQVEASASTATTIPKPFPPCV